MKKEVKAGKRMCKAATQDMRGMLITIGDTVLAREKFPKTNTIVWGTVSEIHTNKGGVVEVKLKELKKYYRNPLKLADK